MTDNTNHQPPPGDVLDRAAAAVQGAAVPPPPADLLAATVAAVHNRITLAEAAEVARRRRRRLVMRATGVGGLAACVAVAVMWGGGSHAREVSFERMLDNLAKVEAVSFVERQVTHNDGSNGKPYEIKYLVRGQQSRMELRGGETTYVYDRVGRRALITSRQTRTYEVFPLPDLYHVMTADQLLADLRRLRALTARPAGEEQVNGVAAVVFKVAGGTWEGKTGDFTLWVDRKTELPVKLAFVSAKRRPDRPQTDITYQQFDWSPTLQDSLFSLDPPAGYTEGIEGFVKPRSVPEKTHHVSLKIAAEAVAAAPCMVVTNTQRLLPGRPELTAKMYTRGKQLRMEFLNPGGHGLPDPTAVPAIETLVGAFDGEQTLHLNFAEKTAKFEKRQGTRPATFPDLVAGFRQLKDEDGEPAGEEKVGDVTAKMFKLKNADFIGANGPDLVTTVWLDVATSLPVRVRVTDGTMELKFDRFEWPATLADALFSLTPPKGFAVGEFVPPAGGPAKK